MQSIRFRLTLAALGLALAAPTLAQETPAPPADAPAAAETPAPAAPAAPATGGAQPAPVAPATPDAQPAPEAPGAGAGAAAPGAPAAPGGAPAAGDPAQPEVMEIVRDTFGDWQVRCAPDGKECFMYQLAVDQEQNPVAEVSILKLPDVADADAGVTVVSPLGTLLTSGVVLQIDGGERRQYPFAWCSQVGCFARFGLDAPSLTGMKRGSAGKITLVSVGQPEAPVTLDLSLSGFTAAYDFARGPGRPGGAGRPGPEPGPRRAEPGPRRPRRPGAELTAPAQAKASSTRTAFSPPKAKAFVITTRTSRWRATFGTTSRSHSGSGSS